MSNQDLTIAVGQFAPTSDPEHNIAVITELATLAAARGARLVVFPEYANYFVDPFDESLLAYAQDLDGPFVQVLTALARDLEIFITAGLLERSSEVGKVRNTVVTVNADGLVSRYRKLHLYDAFGQKESRWVEPGQIEMPQTFVIDGIRLGTMTCYDLRFPEVTRTLADADVDAVVVAAEWVRGPLKEHHWRTLLTARAIENTVYVVAADHAPPLGVGHSMIVDPSGVAIGAIGTGEGIAIGHITREEISRVREINPALSLRRYRVEPGA